MTEEKINAYELSEFAVDVLRGVAHTGVFSVDRSYFLLEVEEGVKLLSAKIERDAPGIDDGDKELLDALKGVLKSVKEYCKNISAIDDQLGRLTKTIYGCADRGWINEKDIDDLKIYWR